jgi:epoxyqueuosine reductase
LEKPIEEKIREKALELGIEKCGIIKVEAMLDYADRLRERMGRIPNGEAVYGGFMRFADVRLTFPWAKSIIVGVLGYGHYRLPASTRGHFGKYYLVDARANPASPENGKIAAFDGYLHELGLKTAFNEHPGITAMRWAAYKAGLGLIRRNNFFYTDLGSWVTIYAWAVDREMELIGSHTQRECPPNCDRCVKACPTQSLSKAYTMDMTSCVSFLTTSNSPQAYDDDTNRKMGCWFYGCDACQDACPMNKNTWHEKDDFPGLEVLGDYLTPESILTMGYDEIAEKLAQKFFYIKQESLWRWKLNAINVMVNDYRDSYAPLFRDALKDESELVREKAEWALEKLGK